MIKMIGNIGIGMKQSVSVSERPPKRKGKYVTKEKALTYLKEYTTNGFNKTKAIRKVNPNLSYESANKHTTQYHNSVVNSGYYEDFDIDKEITKEYILSRLKYEADHAKKSSDKREALNLLGKFLALWTDKTINKTELSTNDKTILDKYISINQLQQHT